MGFRVIFESEFGDETNIFLYVFSLLFHAFHVVGAFLLVDSFEHLLVFLHDSEQFFLPEGLVKGSIETGVGFIVILLLNLQV